MLKLSELKPYKGAITRRKVVGRGLGSSHGTYSGRGIKGQKSRAGSSIPAGFEGGRMPLQRQIPKRRGFTSLNLKAVVLNLANLADKFKAGEEITPKALYNKRLIKSSQSVVKILSQGEISKGLIFKKVLVSKKAQEKIEQAGGKIIDER